MARKVFVTGIGTDVGKTVASAILARAWKMDYWKPIQAGHLDDLESDKVKRLLTDTKSKVHPTHIQLTQATSPHFAAQHDGMEIQIQQLEVPITERPLLIEGAGGIMAPINSQQTMLDFVKHHHCEIVVVSRNYVGSINHTLLTLEIIQQQQLPLIGIIFNDNDYYQSIPFITNYAKVQVIGEIPLLKKIDLDTINSIASTFYKPDWVKE
ncbi:MAG: dethiobiotin synthase [Candidatus Competibacteraceae bacterium]|nr:dethiobiotin synthase [Candidatus Competibacteraceae bacterium]